MLWIAGVTNATNLIDGLDGLAGGVSLITVGTLLVLAVVRGDPLMVLFMSALGGAIGGFLIYNTNPASIFMGDTGSMFLGFVLATSSIHTASKATTVVALAVPMLALGIPIADTLIAMTRRAFRGAPLFSADRGHLHHRLLDKGLSHRAAVLVIYGGAGFFGLAALLVSFSNAPQAAAVLVLVAVAAFVVLRALGLADLGLARRALADRRRNLQVRAAIRAAAEKLHQARDTDQVWSTVCSMAPTFGASAVSLKLGQRHAGGLPGEWSFGFDTLPSSALRARFSLVTDHASDDVLELAWTDGRERLHRDTEIGVELLCEHATTALERLERQGGGADGRAKAKVIPLKR
jgi:UDP-GlcNAc:undecaprenyl-phosphate GlcNAc-1-phosphate transferase